MSTSRLAITCAGLLCGALLAQGPAPRTTGAQPSCVTLPGFRFSQVDFPGAAETYLFGENATGLTTGAFVVTGQHPHAFIIDRGTFKALDTGGVLGQNPSYALTCNDLGVVVGQWATPDWSVSHGYTWCRGVFTTVDYPGSSFSAVYGINNLGTLIGIWTDGAGATQGYIRERGAFTPLTGPGVTSIVPYSINIAGTIVGQLTAAADGQAHGFLRTRDGKYTLLDAPGAEPGSTVAISINDLGFILGFYSMADGTYHGFLKVGARYLPLDYPGSDLTVTQTINDFQRVVGYFVDAGGLAHGFVAVPDLF